MTKRKYVVSGIKTLRSVEHPQQGTISITLHTPRFTDLGYVDLTKEISDIETSLNAPGNAIIAELKELLTPRWVNGVPTGVSYKRGLDGQVTRAELCGYNFQHICELLGIDLGTIPSVEG